MNGKTGLILVIVIFALLLFAVVTMRGKHDKAVGVKELKTQKIDKDKVTRFEVALPAGEAGADGAPASPPKKVVVEKEGEAWKVYDAAVADRKFGVDEVQIKSALDAAAEFATGDLIANKKEKLADYEIDDDKGMAVKVFTGKDVALDLVFGRAAKGGGSTVRQAGSDEVYVAKGRLSSVLKRDPTAWRKKGIVDFKAEDVTQVKTTLADGSSWTVASEGAPPPAKEGEPAPKAEWKLVEPATLPAAFRLDKNAVSRPAAQIASLRAQDFADGVSDADAGVDKPSAVVEATTKDGKKTVIRLGKEDEKKRTFAKVDGDPQMYLLASFSAKQLGKKLDELRDLALIDAAIDDVEKVTIKGSGGTFVVKKDGADWKLVEPKTPPAEFDATTIASTVASLLRTRATRTALDVDGKTAGVDKASPFVEVQLAGGKKQTLRFGNALPIEPVEGKPPEKDAKPREYYVKGGLDDNTYVIAAFTRNRYDKPADLFKKPPEQPPMSKGPGGSSGMIPGMENLPPEVRKKLEEQIKSGQFPGGAPHGGGAPPGHP
jgi:hypothetical protein